MKDVTMSETPDDPLQLAAGMLQAMRRARGYSSATAAADFFGWPASRYRSHESGARRILPADAKRYCEGYGMPTGSLTKPNRKRLEELVERVHVYDETKRAEAAKRLKCARILAGHDSARRAAAAWNWAPTTYLMHESGESAMGRTAIEMYAAAYGVDGRWLRDGSLPSGMGKVVDREIRDAIEQPERFRGARQPKPPTELAMIERLRGALKAGRPGASTRIKEYRWDDVAASGGRLDAIAAINVWNVPASVMPDGSGAFIVAGVGPSRHQRWYCVLPRVRTDRRNRSYLIAEDDRLRSVEGPLNDALAARALGGIVGTIDAGISFF